ncbi:MAG: phosphate ABC transporter substrate-binding protein [Helicobacteraceae bacterium]|jgi:phosphate transport system substrate-binding protein|nr:phosphate ABC transporter substrate-binding protein [Helicobacteraceae bacterium]
MRFIFSLLAAFACLFAGDLDRFKDLKGSLDIVGGTAHIPVMKEAAKRIMRFNGEIKISVAGGGSGVGVQKVGEGLAQIGNTGRALKEGEIEKYGLKSYPFAIDGVAAIVHTSNKVGALSKAQLTDIFSGKIANWKEVGGIDAPIALYVREDGSGTRETFEERATNKTAPSQKSSVVNSNGAMKIAVGGDKNAIGYVGIGHLDDKVKGVTIDGMIPTQENASSGAYSVTRLLYMNTKADVSPLTKAFIDYIFSDEGQKIVIEAGYIPVK